MSDQPVVQAPPPRWRRRKQARPRELLESALAVFVARGFAATRMQDVARRAGVTKGTLYLYYPSKEELFKAVVRETVLAAVEKGEALVAGFKGSAKDLMRELVADYWRTMGETGRPAADHRSSTARTARCAFWRVSAAQVR